MKTLPIPLLLLSLLVLALVVILWRTSRPHSGRTSPYTKRPSLLTPAEMRFYRELSVAISPSFVVFVKVRLMDVVTVPDGAWQQYGAPGSGMHLDFVLADADTLVALLVIELDDRSHWRSEAQHRDALKYTALASAGVPVVRMPAAARYDDRDLRDKISGVL